MLRPNAFLIQRLNSTTESDDYSRSVQFAPDSLSSFDRIGCPLSVGLRVQFGSEYAKIAESLEVTVQTVERVRIRLVLDGYDAVLKRRAYTQKVSRKKVDGDVEAHLLALTCSEAPEGYSRWSLRLLADQMVELGYIESISYEAVRQTLKKTS